MKSARILHDGDLLLRTALVAGCLLLSVICSARSETQTWSPSGGRGSDEDGTWNTTTANWSGEEWTNGNDAVFNGFGGTVTVANISANSLTFDASGPFTLQSGTINMSGNTVTVNSAVTISSAISVFSNLYLSGTGALTLSGNSSVASGGEFLFESNLATVDISGGGNVSDQDVSVGYETSNGGKVTVSGTGSTWTTSGAFNVGVYGTGAVSITNGGVVSAPSVEIGQSGTGTLLITNEGTLTSGGGILGENESTVLEASGTVIVSGTGSAWNAGGGGDATIAVGEGTQFPGDGLLRITNGGSVTTGQVTVGTSGTFAFGPNATLNSQLVVNGGMLEGSGSGSSVAIDGDVTLDNATMVLDIDATSNATDSLDITDGGDLTLDDTDTLTVDLVNGTQLDQSSYILASLSGGGAIDGNFTNLNIPAGYEIDYGNPSELLLVAVVPEPGTTALMLCGAGLLAWFGRLTASRHARSAPPGRRARRGRW
jgi:T5SS/PEP-CTERM-associated repeat protein